MNNFDILYFCIEYAGLRYFFVDFRRFPSIFVDFRAYWYENRRKTDSGGRFLAVDFCAAYTTEICLRLQERHRA